MHILTLLQHNGAVSSAQADSSATPQLGEVGEEVPQISFHALMDRGDQVDLEIEFVDQAFFDPGAALLGDPAHAPLRPLDLTEGPLLKATVGEGGRANSTNVGLPNEDADMVEGAALPVDSVRSQNVISDLAPVSTNADFSKPDDAMSDGAHVSLVPIVAPLGVPHIEQSMTLRATLGTQKDTEHTGAPAIAQQSIAEGSSQYRVSAEPKQAPLSIETVVVQKTSIAASAGWPTESIVSKDQPVDVGEENPKDVLKQYFKSHDALLAPVPQGMNVPMSEKALVQNERRNILGSDVLVRDVSALGSQTEIDQQKTLMPSGQTREKKQELIAIQTPETQDSSKPMPFPGEGMGTRQIEKQGESATVSASSQGQSQTQITGQQPPLFSSIVSNTVLSGAKHYANDAPMKEASDAFVPHLETAQMETSTEKAAQPSSAPTAERSAELYSGVTDVAKLQAAAEREAKPQDMELPTFYGSVDGASARLETLSQIDPLSPTSRVELPARLAAQIADVARQLPDGPIEISLSPEELGKVKLTFQVSENGAMNVVVAAERAETLEFMRRNVDSLLAEFSELGYEGSSFQFQQDDQSGSGENADQFGASQTSTTGDTDDRAQNATTDSTVSSPVRLHLDGTSGMDLRL